MAGNGYIEIHDILKHELGDIMPDGQIIILAQRICANAGTLARIGIMDEFNKTFLNELRDECTERLERIFNNETKLEVDMSHVDSGNTEGV